MCLYSKNETLPPNSQQHFIYMQLDKTVLNGHSWLQECGIMRVWGVGQGVLILQGMEMGKDRDKKIRAFKEMT